MDTDSSSTSKVLEIIKLNIQESKRCQEEDMEYYCILAEEHQTQVEEQQEE